MVEETQRPETPKLTFIGEWNQIGIEKRLYACLAHLSERAAQGNQTASVNCHRLIQDYASLKQDYITNLERMVRRYEELH